MSPHAPLDALPEERQRVILQRLQQHGRVVAAELALHFGVSEDSIRRDLRELAARGLCHRVYGGALANGPDATPLRQRREHQGERKKALAATAVSLLTRGQVLMLDAGSTNSAIAQVLPADLQLTVVTNAPDIAQCLIERGGFQIQLLGGRIDARSGAALGARTVEDIRQLRAGLCFPGACAVDAQSGLWAMDGEEASIKRAMIESSAVTVVVATRDKLGASAIHQVASLEQIEHLVVEHDTDATALAAFETGALSVIRAAPL